MLWVQQRVRNNDLDLYCVPGDRNPADIFTKPNIPYERMDSLLRSMGCMFADGRPESAPLLRKEKGTNAFGFEDPGTRSPQRGLLRQNGEGENGARVGMASRPNLGIIKGGAGRGTSLRERRDQPGEAGTPPPTVKSASRRHTVRWVDAPDEYDVVAEETVVRGIPHQRPSSDIASLRYSEVEVKDERLESVIAEHGEGGSDLEHSLCCDPPDATDTGHGDETQLPHTSATNHWQLSHHLPPAVTMYERGLAIGKAGNGRAPLSVFQQEVAVSEPSLVAAGGYSRWRSRSSRRTPEGRVTNDEQGSCVTSADGQGACKIVVSELGSLQAGTAADSLHAQCRVLCREHPLGPPKREDRWSGGGRKVCMLSLPAVMYIVVMSLSP